MGIVGLAIYDKLYGVDEAFKVEIGKEFREAVMRQIKEKLQNPETKMIGKKYHPDQDLAERYDQAFASVFLAAMVKPFEPEWSREIYEHVRDYFMEDLPFDLGAYVMDSMQKSGTGELISKNPYEAGMVGESRMNIFLMQMASREFDDKKTFDRINKMLTNIMRPAWVESEVRYDTDENSEPSGTEDFTVGQLFNMYSGWVMLPKVHLGWEKILDYDWTKNRNPDGTTLDNSGWR